MVIGMLEKGYRNSVGFQQWVAHRRREGIFMLESERFELKKFESKKLEKFLEKMKRKYGDGVVVKRDAENCKNLDEIPAPLKDFYSVYESVEFPFGRIDPVEIAKKRSDTEEPFRSGEWFCFGADRYFSFWLCSYHADGEGLWITPWDHEAGEEMECVYGDLVEFLQDMEEEYAGYLEENGE